MRLIHISDPHLTSPEHPLSGRPRMAKRLLGRGSWRRRRRHRHRREWLDALVGAVQAANPDQIVVTGDLTQIGLPEEIEEAALWLEALGPPTRVLLVPGNHDVYAEDSWAAVSACWSPYLHLDADYPVIRQLDDVTLLGASSALPTRLGSACGALGSGQLERLEQALSAAADGPRVLALHHPPLPGMSRFRKRLRDAPALAERLSRLPVDLVLHGHGHHSVRREQEALRVLGIGSASYERSSYREIHCARTQTGWLLDVALVVRNAAGDFETVERLSWMAGARDYSASQRSPSQLDTVSVPPSAS